MDMCCGHAPALEDKESYLGRWMDILRPGFERVKDIPDHAERIAALEQQAVLVSLENLMTFPFVRSAVAAGELTVHGLLNDIGAGGLSQYDMASGTFLPL
jgi:carbonic anhydrase